MTSPYIVVVRNIADDITKSELVSHFPKPIINFTFYNESKFRYSAILEFSTLKHFEMALELSNKINLGHYCRAKVEMYLDKEIFTRFRKKNYNNILFTLYDDRPSRLTLHRLPSFDEFLEKRHDGLPTYEQSLY